MLTRFWNAALDGIEIPSEFLHGVPLVSPLTPSRHGSCKGAELMIHFQDLKTAYTAPLLSYFKKFVWLHPQLFKIPAKLLVYAKREGQVRACQKSPWLYLSPEIFYRLNPQARRSNKAWRKIEAGPEDHESMIYRIGFSLYRVPHSVLDLDESISEKSKPAAWGAFTHIQPDLLLSFHHPWNTPLWIECERSLKSARFYSERLEKLKAYRVIYIVPQQKMVAFMNRVGPLLSQRFQVFDELKWYKRARQLCRKYQKSAHQEPVLLPRRAEVPCKIKDTLKFWRAP